MGGSERSYDDRRIMYVDFRNSRFYFGFRFLTAVVLIVASVVGAALADASTGIGRAVLTAVALGGVVIGLLLQPSRKPDEPRARQALEKLADASELIADVQRVNERLLREDDLVQVRMGLAHATDNLKRTKNHVINCMADWDKIAPGAFDNVQSTRKRGHQMLMEMADNLGADHE